MLRKKKSLGQSQNNMDTQKLTSLAIEGNVDKIKEYRDELVRLMNSKNIVLIRTKSTLERIKLIPGTDETVTQYTKIIEEIEKTIQDAQDTINIIDKWTF